METLIALTLKAQQNGPSTDLRLETTTELNLNGRLVFPLFLPLKQFLNSLALTFFICKLRIVRLTFKTCYAESANTSVKGN